MLRQGGRPHARAMSLSRAIFAAALVLATPAAAGDDCATRPYGEARLTPDDPRPARLAAVRKVTWVRAELDYRLPASVSPDGAAYFVVRRRLGLQFGPEAAGASPQLVALPDIADADEIGHRRPAPFAWSSESRSV